MQTILALILCLQVAPLTDLEIQVRVAIAIAGAKHVPAPVVKTPAKRFERGPVVYSWRVKRVARPAGYADFNVEGDFNPSHAFAYQHLMSTHGAAIRNITAHCDLSGMSTRDIMALHSSIHSRTPYGHWVKSGDALTGEVITFVFELP